MELLAAYADAAARVKDASTVAEAKAIYEQVYFPLAVARIALQAQPVDVLILTVGTQPYSVALSLSYSPASTVYFVATDESAPSVPQATELSGFQGETRLRNVTRADSTAVFATIREAIESHPDEKIAIDFTSGTKAMTAAASTIAGYLGLRQIYIESVRLRPDASLFGKERAHEVPHPLQVLGDPKREEAERHFDELLFRSAESLFAELDRARAPDFHFAARVSLCRTYDAWRGLRFEAAGEHLNEAIDLLKRTPQNLLTREPMVGMTTRLESQRRALGRLEDATKQRANPPQFDPELASSLTRFFLAEARRAEARRRDLAALLYYRALELSLQRRLATHGVDAGNVQAPDPDTLLAAYNKVIREPHKLTELPDKVAVSQCFGLLRALRDTVVSSVMADIGLKPGAFYGVLTGRNSSIFAHGFERLDEARLESFKEKVLPFVSRTAEQDGFGLDLRDDTDFDFVRFRTDLPAS